MIGSSRLGREIRGNIIRRSKKWISTQTEKKRMVGERGEARVEEKNWIPMLPAVDSTIQFQRDWVDVPHANESLNSSPRSFVSTAT